MLTNSSSSRARATRDGYHMAITWVRRSLGESGLRGGTRTPTLRAITTTRHHVAIADAGAHVVHVLALGVGPRAMR